MTRSAPDAARRPTNVTLPEALVLEARALDINVSKACERGLSDEVANARAKRWIEQNRPAMDAWNDYVEKHGIPLSEYRQF